MRQWLAVMLVLLFSGCTAPTDHSRHPLIPQRVHASSSWPGCFPITARTSPGSTAMAGSLALRGGGLEVWGAAEAELKEESSIVPDSSDAWELSSSQSLLMRSAAPVGSPHASSSPSGRSSPAGRLHPRIAASPNGVASSSGHDEVDKASEQRAGDDNELHQQMRELGLGEQSGETPQTGLSGGDHEDAHAWDEPLSSTPGSAADGAGGGERGDRKGGGEGGETPRPESQGAAAAGDSGPGAEVLKSTRGRPKGSFPGKGSGGAQRRPSSKTPGGKAGRRPGGAVAAATERGLTYQSEGGHEWEGGQWEFTMEVPGAPVALKRPRHVLGHTLSPRELPSPSWLALAVCN